MGNAGCDSDYLAFSASVQVGDFDLLTVRVRRLLAGTRHPFTDTSFKTERRLRYELPYFGCTLPGYLCYPHAHLLPSLAPTAKLKKR